MILSQYTIHTIINKAVQVPERDMFVLPEKILQFGTDAVLLGGPDHIIGNANRQGVFDGRIVVEQHAEIAAGFEKQDCLYTVQTNGPDAVPVFHSINAAISREAALKEQFGYTDSLFKVADVKQTWSIEGDKTIKKVVSFALADNDVMISPGKVQQSITNLLEP